MTDIPVNLGSRSYRILVGAGALGTVGAELAKLRVGRKVALVTDPAILPDCTASRWRGASPPPASTWSRLLRPGGRAGQDARDGAGSCGTGCWTQGCDRSSTVVALGGGAVGDLAGFVAATYMRGINFVQVPTTLLAQVDASIGGKTAIDHPRAKNLIGAFHQPRLVLVDPAALTTLPEREFRSGLAEVIKHGIVLDAAYFEDLEANVAALLGRDLTTLERVVAGSCRLKARVVERDEQEAELRWVLNYGHTIGHAIEAATGYRRLDPRRGRLAGHRGGGSAGRALGDRQPRPRRKRQLSLLAAVGLPVRGIRVEPAAVVEALSRDKKSRDGRIPFVFAPEIGSFRLVSDVPRDAVLEVLKDLV